VVLLDALRLGCGARGVEGEEEGPLTPCAPAPQVSDSPFDEIVIPVVRALRFSSAPLVAGAGRHTTTFS